MNQFTHRKLPTSSELQQDEFDIPQKQKINKLNKIQFLIIGFLVSCLLITSYFLYEIKKQLAQTKSTVIISGQQWRQICNKKLLSDISTQIKSHQTKKQKQQSQRIKELENNIIKNNQLLAERIDNQFKELNKQNNLIKEQNQVLTKNILNYKNQIISSITNNENKKKQFQNKLTSDPKSKYPRHFNQTPHTLQIVPSFKWFNKNLGHYLSKNKVKNVLQINCLNECRDKYVKHQDYKQFEATFLSSSQYKQIELIPDWIIIRISQQEINKLPRLVHKFANKTKIGISIVFKNMSQYKTFVKQQKQAVFQIMDYYNLKYDQAISLNLRRREGAIVLVFNFDIKTSSFPFKKPIKNMIGIQVVFKPNENIHYLRQWIGYHMYLGIDKFFLYDNNGTLGEPNRSSVQQNKHGIPFECLNLTEQKIINLFNDIWEQFYEHIVYIPWQPLDAKGQITYAQVEAQADFINNFQDVTSYTGFTDMDQMIFSVDNLSISQYLVNKTLHGYSGIKLRQKKFTNRFCIPNSRQLEINQTFAANTIGLFEKLFFETQQFYPGTNIHKGRVYQGKIFDVDNFNQWRLNHYNLGNSMVYNIQKNFFGGGQKITYDNQGKKYKEILDKICQGKCSQSFKVSCNLNQAKKFNCPAEGKNYPTYGKKVTQIVN